MASPLADFGVFIGAVVAHVVTLLAGCAVTVVINLIERYLLKGKRVPVWIDIAILLLFCLVACFQAWRDEQRNTETVIGLRAQAESAHNRCESGLQIEQANYRGLLEQNGVARTTIDKQAVSLAQQQGTINSCVISLGKMNPLANRSIRVATSPISMPVNGPDPKVQYHLFEIAIMTNYKTDPQGKLNCEQSFQLAGVPMLPITGPYLAYEMTGPPDTTVSRTHDINVSEGGTYWTDENPILLAAVTAESTLGHCSFDLANPK